MAEWIIVLGLMRGDIPVTLKEHYSTSQTCETAGNSWEERARAWAQRSGIHFTGFWKCKGPNGSTIEVYGL